jgi:hypothetical protein
MHLKRFLLGDGNLGLEVAPDKELQKEEKIASIHEKGCRVVFLFNFAFLVCAVKIEPQHGDDDTNNHLRNLETSDDHRVEPLGAEFHGHQKVISVHASVNTVVHGDKENSWRRGRDIRMPAIKQNRHVMVPMQEDERLLVNNNKEGINKLAVNGREDVRKQKNIILLGPFSKLDLRKFAQNKKLDPKSRRSRTIRRSGI